MRSSRQSSTVSERRRAIQDAYDELAETYDDRRSDDPDGGGLLSAVTGRLPDGARILDAGCGQGAPVAASLAGAFVVTGVDLSRGQLRLARENAPGTDLVQGDPTALPLATGVFDAVCAYFSVIHDPADEQGDVIAEFARVLRPGGLALLTVGHEPWVGSTPDWLDSGVEMYRSTVGIETTREHLAREGFELLGEWTVSDEPGGEFPFLLVELRL